MNGNIGEDHLSNHDHQGNVDVDGGDTNDVIQALVTENKMLKENLEESNASMRTAYEKFAIANEEFSNKSRVFEEKFREARDVVMSLREQIQEKDRTIESLKNQTPQWQPDTRENETLRNQLQLMKKTAESAIQERDELKNKCASLEMQLDSLADQQKDDRQSTEMLKRSINQFQMSQLREQRDKQELSDSLNHLRQKFDELISEYEKVINDEKIHKAAVLTKENQVIRLERQVQRLESDVTQYHNQAEFFKSHFEAERHQRQSLNNECIALKTHLMRITAAKQKQPPPSGPASLNSKPRDGYCICPKCGHKAPNMESLLQHSHSCEE